MTKDQTNRETYDRIADIYISKHFNAITLKGPMDKFISLLPAGATVLDLGCGPGQAANFFFGSKDYK